MAPPLADQATPAKAQAPPGTVAAPAPRIVPASSAAPARALPALLYCGPTRYCAAAAEVEAQALLDAVVPLVGFHIGWLVTYTSGVPPWCRSWALTSGG